jgi:hypothetical protein
LKKWTKERGKRKMAKGLERITGDASIKRYFDTDYIGAYSLDEGAEPILTIDSLWYGELTLGGGRKEPHVVVKFTEKRVPGVDEVKPLILNATNRKTLKKLFGDDSAATLEGKQIQLYIDPKVRDPQDGGFTEGLRIRPFKPKIKADAPIICESEGCGQVVSGFGKMNAMQMAEYTRSSYGKILCADCAKAAKAAKDAKAAASDVLGAVSEPDMSEQTEQEVSHANN